MKIYYFDKNNNNSKCNVKRYEDNIHYILYLNICTPGPRKNIKDAIARELYRYLNELLV